MLKTAIVALCLAALATPANASNLCTSPPPPPANRQIEPTVPYRITTTNTFAVQIMCHDDDARACSIRPPSAQSKDQWIIVIDSQFSKPEQQCLLTYEKAHMPPNFWGDPSVEASKTMASYGLTP